MTFEWTASVSRAGQRRQPALGRLDVGQRILARLAETEHRASSSVTCRLETADCSEQVGGPPERKPPSRPREELPMPLVANSGPTLIASSGETSVRPPTWHASCIHSLRASQLASRRLDPRRAEHAGARRYTCAGQIAQPNTIRAGDKRHGNPYRGAVPAPGCGRNAGERAGGDERGRARRRAAHPRSRPHHRPAPRAALHVAAPLRISRTAARRVRRPRLSARPGRAAQADQAIAVRRLARRRRRSARRHRRCNRCSDSRSTSPRRCRRRYRDGGQAARRASHRRDAESSVQAPRRAGAAQVPRADADSAQRGGARARRARRNAERTRNCASPTSRNGCCAT